MRFLKNPFGRKDNEAVLRLTKTASMMDEDLYWRIISETLKMELAQDAQEIYYEKKLKQLSPVEIIGFRLRTDKLLFDTYSSEMWCAAYILNGGCSDDGFEYFRCWLISRGKDVYSKAKKNPDSLVSFADEDDDFEFESFGYVANKAFKSKFGKDLDDFIDEHNFPFREADYYPIKFNWREEDPLSMKAICPQLFKARWDE